MLCVTKSTPLHGAAVWSHVEVCRELIAAGAKKFAKNSDDATPGQVVGIKDYNSVDRVERKKAVQELLGAPTSAPTPASTRGPAFMRAHDSAPSWLRGSARAAAPAPTPVPARPVDPQKQLFHACEKGDVAAVTNLLQSESAPDLINCISVAYNNVSDVFSSEIFAYL